MKKPKTIDRRYLRRTEISRDSWKERAFKYQKKIRSLGFSLREKIFSRDKWKTQAIQAKTLLKEQETQIQILKQQVKTLELEQQILVQQLKNKGLELPTSPEQLDPQSISLEHSKPQLEIKQPNLPDDPTNFNHYSQEYSQTILTSKPEKYTYPIYIIQLAIQQRIVSFTSWRGIEKTFKLWSQFFDIPTPSYLTIRQWFLKVGLFELRQPKERRDDWLFLIDTTWGQGQKKCFVILGIPYQIWQQKLHNHQCLQYQDVTVLDIDVLETTNHQIIAQKISHLSDLVGPPLQIISDHGPDIKTGIELYLNHFPQVIYTYDFTHQVALWLKHSLSNNQLFQQFSQQSHLTRSQIQQTSLSFLIPPKSHYKARYHNVDILIQWGLNVLRYWDKQDFSRISPQHHIGKNQFLSRLGWLLDYRAELSLYNDMLSVFQAAFQLLIHQGLHQNSLQDWQQLSSQFSPSPWIKDSIDLVSNYLIFESQKIPPNHIFLAVSDILESLFSKSKIVSSSAPYSEVNEIMILSLILSTTQFNPERILDAMNSIDTITLNLWIDKIFGQSMAAKRKQAFSSD